MKAAQTFDAEVFIRRLDAMDKVLVRAGFPPTSAFWQRDRQRFFRALALRDPHRRRLAIRRWVLRVGRRGGKSSNLCRIAVAWALWGAWDVPAGDIAVIGFISKDRDEAAARLRTIAAILDALGISYDARGDDIELRDKRCAFRVLTCSVAGVVGPTVVLLVGDEMAHWESRENKADPAPLVMGSSRPAMASQPFAFEIDSSAPWASDDYHAQLFDAGNTDAQLVSHAATWEANPTISEQDTRDIEPDPKLWSMNYAALPGLVVSLANDPVDVAACFERMPPSSLSRPWLAMDPSSLRGDAFAYVAGKEGDSGELAVLEVGGWSGDELRGVTMNDVVRHIAHRAKILGISTIFSDQREEASLRSMFSDHVIKLVSYAWSETSKDDAVMRLRRLMRERKLYLPAHEQLRRELSTMKARLMPNGRTKYETNGLDFASALITLMHAAVAGAVLKPKVRPVVKASPPVLYRSPMTGVLEGSLSGSHGGGGDDGYSPDLQRVADNFYESTRPRRY